jgi:hypothetical protein
MSGDPELVRRGRAEPPLDQILRTRGGGIGDCGAFHLAAPHTLQAKLFHQPLDGAAGHRDSFPVQLQPHLAGTVDAETLSVYP